MAVMRLLCLVAALPAAAAASAERAAVTPIEKVIELLTGMTATAKEEKHQEEVEFAKFSAWCSGTRAATTKSIAAGASQIETLSADIAKAKADAEVLAKEVSELQVEADKASAEAASAKSEREKEQADFEAQYQDFSESIDATKRAVEVLKARSADVPQSLIQVQSLRLLPATAKAAVDSFLQQQPEANAYEFQSGSVVSLLEKLTVDFQDQRLALEKAEISAKSSYELLAQQLFDNVKAAKAGAAKKTGEKSSRLERAAAATGELESTKASKAADEKTLADTLAECATRSTSYEKDQVTRSEEVKALEAAVGILGGDSVAGNAQTYLPTLVQKGTALAQLRSRTSQDPELRKKLVEFLQAQAKESGSRFLALAAARASEDPFAKVTSMIKDLITKLTEQANSEADHHGYCTSELATNQQTREDKSSEVEELAAKLDNLNSESARLAGEVAELTASLAAIRQQQAEATQLRDQERTINAKTVADAKESQTAVAKATKVLKDFYGKAKEATLLQGGRTLAEEMSTAATPYKGQQSESTGVFGLLEVILSDFARLEAETSSAEDQATTTYQRFMDETTETIAVKDTTLEHEQSAKRQTDEKALATKKELNLTQQELDTALEYYDKLKADCLDTGLSYEDRVKAREQEVNSLQEALAMLAQQNLA